MKGYRFYADMPQDRKSKSASKANPFDPWTVGRLRDKAADGFQCDVIAVDLDDAGRPYWQGSSLNMDCTAVAIEGNAYSYCGSGCARDYLSSRAVRIPEELARDLAPRLFLYLGSR